MPKRHTAKDGLGSYPDFFWQCRAFGSHTWRIMNVEHVVPGFEIHYACAECGTLKFEYRDGQGRLVRRTYTYPDGYQFEKGVKPHSSYFFVKIAQRYRA